MSRTCTVCSHKSRVKIDKAIVFGESNRAIASQFGLTRASVQRHKQHVAAAIELAAQKREISVGESILDRFETLYQRNDALLSKAESAKNFSAAVACVREARGILGDIHEITMAAASSRQATEPSPRYNSAEYYRRKAEAEDELIRKLLGDSDSGPVIHEELPPEDKTRNEKSTEGLTP